MSPDELRSLLTSGTLVPPFEIIAGGRTYLVEDIANIWLPSAYPDVAVVAVAGQGIGIIRLASIDSITCEEHEAVSAGRK